MLQIHDEFPIIIDETQKALKREDEIGGYPLYTGAGEVATNPVKVRKEKCLVPPPSYKPGTHLGKFLPPVRNEQACC
jgi:hypothetical protein